MKTWSAARYQGKDWVELLLRTHSVFLEGKMN